MKSAGFFSQDSAYHMETVSRTIDIRKTFRESNSLIINSLPSFFIRLIEKLIHQDEMNSTIYRHRDKSGIPFIDDVLADWNVKVIIKGTENIAREGRFVFAANHPVGGIDSLAFFSALGSIFTDVISPSNELLNVIPNLRPLLLGVNVFGRNTRETAEAINDLFRSDSQILIFPAGEVSRRTKGIISDIPWQKSFISKSIQHKRDIVPVFISGQNSGLFYNVARLRKILGLKTYLETILLPREMMNQHNSSVTVTFGKVVPFQSLTDDKSHFEWAQTVKEIVYEIPVPDNE